MDIDKRASIISWSKRPGKPWWMDSREPSDGFTGAVIEALPWQFGDAAKDESWYETMQITTITTFGIECRSFFRSRVQREEARITAWENLQKARAEAAIRKLEVFFESNRCFYIENAAKKIFDVCRLDEAGEEAVLVDGEDTEQAKGGREEV